MPTAAFPRLRLTLFRGGEIRAGNGALERDARVRSPAKYITGNPSWVLQLWLPR